MRIPLIRALGWFVLADAVLFKLISAVFWTSVIESPESTSAGLYRALANLVHWPTLASLLVGLPVLLVIAVWPRRRWILVAAAAIGGLATFFMIVNAVVFAQYRTHLGLWVWGLLFGGSGRETFLFSTLMRVIIVALFVGGLLLQAGLFWSCGRIAERWSGRRYGARLWAAWTAAFVLLNSWHVWADATYRADITQENGNLPYFYPLTMKRDLHSWGLVDRVAAHEAAAPVTGAGTLYYPQEPLQCRSGASVNVLMVVVDAWRADQLKRDVAPNMEAFSRESLVFRNHIAAGNVTRFAIFAMFYGIPGNYWFPVLRAHTPPVLMQEVVRQGYDLAILGSAPLVSPEFNITVFGGIDGLRVATPGDTPVERDRRVTRDMVAFLEDPDRRKKPFFGFLWLNSVHSYSVPDDAPRVFQPAWEQINYLALNKNFDPTPYFNRYRNALHFVDGEVGRVLDALRRSGTMDNTFVIVTSDHGEEFNDTGKNYWGHNGNFSPYQLQVPLMVRWPAWGLGEVNYLTSHFDLAPTLLQEIFGCSTAPAAYSVGTPLRQADDRRKYVTVVNYNETGIYQPDRVTEFSPFGRFRVYTHDYDKLNEAADPDIVAGATADMLRFSQKPAR
jgi:membrane-anchored protein YejM (alkaline phosphatase superfamily)